MCTALAVEVAGKVLTDAGLLTREKRGTWSCYSVVPERFAEIAAVFA